MKPTHSSSPSIFPNMVARNRRTSRSFRIALVAIDDEGKKWGITTRHAFPDPIPIEVEDSQGQLIGIFEPDERFVYAAAGDVTSHVARIELLDGIDWLEEGNPSRYWPSVLASSTHLLGSEVRHADHLLVTAGIITEVEASVVLRRGPSQERTTVYGACIAELDQDNVLGEAAGGTLFVSLEGDVIGVAIARIQKNKKNLALLAPVATIFESLKLRLWAPPFSHWSDVEDRLQLFRKKVDASKVQDLGPRPKLWGAWT